MTEEKNVTTNDVEKKKQSKIVRGVSDTFLVVLGIFVGMMFVGMVLWGMNILKKPLTSSSDTDGEAYTVGATYEDLLIGPGLGGDLEAGVEELSMDEGVVATEGSVEEPAQQVDTASSVETTNTVAVNTAPVKVYGSWSLLYMNTEKFDADDEDVDDDEEVELKLKDVCKSIYKQNPNVVTYCRETSKLRKTTAADLGVEKCNDGGSCRVGETCLLWNEKEDDGDLKSYTAMYRCE